MYVPGTNGPVFVRLPAPTTHEVGVLTARIATRCEAWLAARGFGPDDPVDEDPDDALSPVQAASVRGRSALGRVRRVQTIGGREHRLPKRCATCDGYTLHAGVAIGAHNRDGLERLCRYIARPPLAKTRLHRRPDGLVTLDLKRPWSDGTTSLVFTPIGLLERLLALVPPPRAHQTLYHGVLAARASWRSAIVPTPPPEPDTPCRTLSRTPSKRSKWVKWAYLLARVFAIDAFACPTCKRPMELRAVVIRPPATTRVIRALQAVALRARGPPHAA